MKYSAFKLHFQHQPYFTHQSLLMLRCPMQTLQNQLRLWERRGDILRLKRGWYTLADHDRKVVADPLVIATHMVMPSYVSLEWALSHYGLIPEQARVITSVTTQKTQGYVTPIATFQYRSIKVQGFGGFVEKKTSDGFVYFLATPEKAVVDFLYYHLSEMDPENTDIFEKSYRFQHLDTLSWDRVFAFAAQLGSKKLGVIVAKLQEWVLNSEMEVL